ncbi:MAG: glycosyl hydrolase family 28-related protein [Scytonema sp. PMC 1069.18]|nr:glycosyl hydrolase family 28-related protein [Scytonema sp. PMC 1069.18]
MISTQKSVLKLFFLFFLVTFTSTCVEYTKNSEVNLAQASPRVKENIRYPNSAAVINVTAPEYGAIPNDGKDDTKAIQKALSQFPGEGKIIYLPNGVYNIFDSLYWSPGQAYRSDYKRITLQGQSRDSVIIQLEDNSPKFQNPAKPRPVISTGFNPDADPNSKEYRASLVAQRFGNSVRNLTINVGKNNPGAEGLNFAANNQGAVRSVKIISSDRKGTTGLALTHGEVGPLLVEDVEIVGFDYGIQANTSTTSISMQSITVREQNQAGIFNGGQAISLEGFNSLNSVSAIINGKNPNRGRDPGSTLVLLNAKLIGRGDAKNVAAISSAGFIYARNVQSSGYKNILKSRARNASQKVKDSVIKEYVSHSISSQFRSTLSNSKIVGLSIKPFPKLEWDEPQTWVSVEKFGAIPNDKKDDTAAFQAAIDSGATTVVVPKTGIFTINGSLRLRKNVRRFVGTNGWIDGNGEIIADNGSQQTLIVENFFIMYDSKVKWKNIAKRAVVYRSIVGLDLESTGTGNLFIDDAVMGKLRFLNSNQSIWARQLNPEGHSEINVVNNGAKLWILGLKTERGNVKIETKNGGFTELLGGLIYATTKQEPNVPIFRVRDASFLLTGVAEAYFDRDTYEIWIEETQGRRKRKLTRDAIPGRMTANGRVLVYYRSINE